MLITDTWVKLTSESGFGASLQKHGLYPVQISYAEVEPTTEDIFVLRDLLAEPFVDTQPNEFIWARALVSDTEVAVEETDLVTGGVDGLRSFQFEIEAVNDVLVLGYHKQRTYFGLSSVDDLKDVRAWIGGTQPPADKTRWLSVKDTMFSFNDGVAGPIYLTEATGSPSNLFVLSSINETDFATLTDLAQICTFDVLVTGGDTLTTASGDTLGYCT